MAPWPRNGELDLRFLLVRPGNSNIPKTRVLSCGQQHPLHSLGCGSLDFVLSEVRRLYPRLGIKSEGKIGETSTSEYLDEELGSAFLSNQPQVRKMFLQQAASLNKHKRKRTRGHVSVASSRTSNKWTLSVFSNAGRSRPHRILPGKRAHNPYLRRYTAHCLPLMSAESENHQVVW